MVAISLYRGNLHRVPNVPRRWLMPTPGISLKDFRLLLSKRDKTLSRLRNTTTPPNPNYNPNSEQQVEVVGDNGCSKQNHLQPTVVPNNNSSKAAPSQLHQTSGDAKDQSELENDPPSEHPREIHGSVSSPGTKSAVPEYGSGPKDGDAGGTSQSLQEEKPLVSIKPNIEISNSGDLQSDREKKKRNLEEKLQIVNEKKHNLVQMLKQILNVEEEMKRRNSMQALMVRPPAPLQVDATVDIGSIPRHTVTKMGSEGNFSGDLEGESEDVSNHNTHARHFHHMHSTSPSAASPLRRPGHSSLQHIAIPQTTRASLGVSGHSQTTSGMFTGVTASPSRFAPTAHQGNPANLPSVSVSGTHFIASSPSPAASGGSSVFRDTRLTSPSWN